MSRNVFLRQDLELAVARWLGGSPPELGPHWVAVVEAITDVLVATGTGDPAPVEKVADLTQEIAGLVAALAEVIE